MTGQGSRFKEAGYNTYKPLIKILGKPIIAYLVSIFDQEDQIEILLREDLMEDLEMVYYLQSLHPNLRVHACAAHKKGPVYTVAQCYGVLSKTAPILVTYCDYYMHWNYTQFKKLVKEKNYDGAIPCYTSFHPHLLHPENVYAACKVDNQMLLTEIREKHSFTEDKKQDYHSAGAYYFKNRELLVNYFHNLMTNGPDLNGEYYVSLVYNQMVQDGLKVWVDDSITHFCQWGTPKDLEESVQWINDANDHKMPLDFDKQRIFSYWKAFLDWEFKK